MKIQMTKTVEVEIKTLRVNLPVLYGEADIPNDFPLRRGNSWEADIDIDTGAIKNWPQGKEDCLYLKVCDGGEYTLLDLSGRTVAAILKDYAPNKLIPGQYGDYVELNINDEGVITNWPANPCIDDFIPIRCGVNQFAAS